MMCNPQIPLRPDFCLEEETVYPRFRAGAYAKLLALILGLFLVTTSNPLSAQVPDQWDAARETVTRTELLDLLERLETQVMSPAYSSRMRTQARESMEVIERRLREGDFQVGDRVVLEVEGEPELSDTLTVRSGPAVTVPIVGALSLAGVLRSELQEAMEGHLSNYVRNPVVHTQALIRLSVLGEVGSPGFYVVPADVPITDILMLAGGPSGNANLPQMRVERGDRRIWDGEAMEMAVIRGMTLDQMNMQAGDRLVIPPGGAQRDGWERVRLVATIVGTVSTLALVLTRAF